MVETQATFRCLGFQRGEIAACRQADAPQAVAVDFDLQAFAALICGSVQVVVLNPFAARRQGDQRLVL